jgi:platelet-activating factor acetylhydrolase IB subunit beta/gamma
MTIHPLVSALMSGSLRPAFQDGHLNAQRRSTLQRCSLTILLGLSGLAAPTWALEYPNPEYNRKPLAERSGWPVSETLGKELSENYWYQRRPRQLYYWLSTPAPDGGGSGPSAWNYLADHNKLVESLASFKKEPRGGDLDILLVGDSITWQWTGRKVKDGTGYGYDTYPQPFNDKWMEAFGSYRTFNIGVGGDKTYGLLWRLDHGAVDGLNPKVVILEIGHNNLFHLEEIQGHFRTTPEDDGDAAGNSAQAIMITVRNLREKFPNAAIVVSKIMPNRSPADPFYGWSLRTNTALDAELRKYIESSGDNRVVLQRDLWSDMTKANGELKAELFQSDLAHLSYEGYGTWANALKEVVSPLLSNPQIPSPVITGQPASREVGDGESVTLSVVASGGAGLSYRWESAPRGGAAFTPIPNAANAATHTFAAAAVSDDGRRFRCVISNSAGAVTSNEAVLTVRPANNPTAITRQPASVSVSRGTPATFVVEVSGQPALSYRWEFALKGSDTFKLFLGDSSPQSIASKRSSVTTSPGGSGNDGRRYRCVVRTSSGTLTSAVATLTVTGLVNTPGPVPATPPVPVPAPRLVGFGSARQTVPTGSGMKSHPPISNYPYPAYANYPELRIQPTGWPLSSEARKHVLLTEGLRYPGRESNKHLPNTWPVTPMARSWGETGDTRWLDRHATLVNRILAKRTNTDIVLMGDSITQGWGGGITLDHTISDEKGNLPFTPFNDAWKSRFSQYSTENMGIGGDSTQSILWRLNHGALDGVNPKVVVLAIGTNNINSTVYNGTAIEAVAQGVKLCVDGIRQRCPNAEVLVVKPFPVGNIGSPTFVNGGKINTAIDGLMLRNDPKVNVLDLYRAFFNPDGTLRSALYSDSGFVHLSALGYDLYAQGLQPSVEALLKNYDQGTAENLVPVSATLSLSSAATQTVTVPFTVSGTAVRNVHYTLDVNSVTIPAGASTADIRLNVIRDPAIGSQPVSLVISLGTPVGATLNWSQREHTVYLNAEPTAPATNNRN